MFRKKIAFILCINLHFIIVSSCSILLAIHYVHSSQPGIVLAIGEGDTGQLGLGPDVMERSKPARVDLPADVIHICAGGMHSVCLTVGGEVSR